MRPGVYSRASSSLTCWSCLRIAPQGPTPSLRDKLRAKGILGSLVRPGKKTRANRTPLAKKGTTSCTPSAGASISSGQPSVASAVAAKASAKASAKGALKAGKGRRYCKGCGLYWPQESFNINDPYCPKDRPAIKRLQRAAAQQGKPELYKAVKSDEARLQNVLKAYHEKVSDREDVSGSRLPAWSWAQYEEYGRCESQTRRRCRGVMMTEDVPLGVGGSCGFVHLSFDSSSSPMFVRCRKCWRPAARERLEVYSCAGVILHMRHAGIYLALCEVSSMSVATSHLQRLSRMRIDTLYGHCLLLHGRGGPCLTCLLLWRTPQLAHAPLLVVLPARLCMRAWSIAITLDVCEVVTCVCVSHAGTLARLCADHRRWEDKRYQG